jgi:competence protein ComEA
MPTILRACLPRVLVSTGCVLLFPCVSILTASSACGDDRLDAAAGAGPPDAGPDAGAAIDAAVAFPGPPDADAGIAAAAASSPEQAPSARRAREALPPLMVKKLEGVVNINEASPEELRLLAGVGPAKIHAILAYRRAHRFRTVDELVRIKGIGRKMLRRLRLHLAVSGPTTAQQVIRPVSLPPVEAAPPTPAPRPAAARARPPQPSPQAPRRTAGQPARPILPHVVFPEAAANHCPRPR